MANHTTDYDVIVVGSGFGGSVTALRLTRSPTTSPSARCRRRRTNCPSPSRPSTTGRRRIAVAGSGARCRGSDSCTSVAASHSSDRSAAGFPVDCSSGPRRCGPTSMRGAGPATRWFRRRSRSSPIERRRDTVECSDCGGRRSTPRRIRANVSYWCRAGPTPDMHYRSRPFGCASRGVRNRNRDTVSRVRR
jgi:hypothetical protein